MRSEEEKKKPDRAWVMHHGPDGGDGRGWEIRGHAWGRTIDEGRAAVASGENEMGD